MDDTATELRATSDALMRDLEVLGAIEDEKRTLAPGYPRLVELAQRVEDRPARSTGKRRTRPESLPRLMRLQRAPGYRRRN